MHRLEFNHMDFRFTKFFKEIYINFLNEIDTIFIKIIENIKQRIILYKYFFCSKYKFIFIHLHLL